MRREECHEFHHCALTMLEAPSFVDSCHLSTSSSSFSYLADADVLLFFSCFVSCEDFAVDTVSLILRLMFPSQAMTAGGDFTATIANVLLHSEAFSVSLDVDSFKGNQLVLMSVHSREIFISHCLE